MEHPNGRPLQAPPWPPAGPGGYLPPQAPVPMSEPDWAALADDHEARVRRRRLWTNGGIAAGCVLLVAVGTVAVVNVQSTSKPAASATAGQTPAADRSAGPADTPSPSAASPSAGASSAASPSPSASSHAPVTTPTVPGQPNLLADHSGQSNLALGPGAGLIPVTGGFALKCKGSADSFAQSSGPVVDTSRSFTVSAWVESDTLDGTRSAISQGDGASFSFDLGREDVNGKKAWVFRVQTGAAGADGTVMQLAGGGAGTVGGWVLLTGTYDAAQKTVSLYVGGTMVGSEKVPGVWSGSGPLELGRSREHSAWAEPWAGVIGHIQVWERALSAAEVGAVLKSGGAGPSAHAWLV